MNTLALLSKVQRKLLNAYADHRCEFTLMNELRA